jgi:hypothetical protein
MEALELSPKTVTMMPHLYDVIREDEEVIKRKDSLKSKLITLEILIKDIEAILQKRFYYQDIGYYEKLINYFYKTYEKIDLHFYQVEFMSEASAELLLDEIENKITYLSEHIKKVSRFLNKKEEIIC